jgi:tRNA pseudouridine32 synthase/23S rRNA pseudouridine746 synthase
MLSILFRDDRFVVVNKPSGLAVHPGPRGGPSVEDHFPELTRRHKGPWLAHRLDSDTSGCLLIALKKSSLSAAQAEFLAGRAEKTYWAVVLGEPAQPAGRIDQPLAKRNTPAGWRMAADPEGVRAVTDWRVLGAAGGLALLELHPLTGRTHQIRVHCAQLGHPVLGDPVYGDGDTGPGLHLLARAIALRLDPPVAATAPVPPHMRQAVDRLLAARG